MSEQPPILDYAKPQLNGKPCHPLLKFVLSFIVSACAWFCSIILLELGGLLFASVAIFLLGVGYCSEQKNRAIGLGLLASLIMGIIAIYILTFGFDY